MLRPAGPRVVLYGRHSSSMQTASSSTDQTASCMKLVNYAGGTVMATYHDQAGHSPR
jgi:site-specific DNA recombinase